ncbi:hypothetical protein PN481_03125 [Nodularia spumigena CS-588/06]|nr:hypothetical protein [Nodularia spumigena CS-588/06]
MERLYRGFDIITNPVHTSNQQRRLFIIIQSNYFKVQINYYIANPI